MLRKLRVAIIFGGRSAEHDVSLQSARSVLAALDREKYEPVLIGIDKQGKWLLGDTSQAALAQAPALPPLAVDAPSVAVVPQGGRGEVVRLQDREPLGAIDVAFPVLHGPYGEDGTVQGLLKLANVPFVGASILGSSIGMDKDVMKRLLRESGLAIANFITLRQGQAVDVDYITARLGLPCFVKPANLGSSVGVSRVETPRGLEIALKTAFAFDLKVIVEEYICGREIECAVLGNDEPQASVPGEVVPHDVFYSYAAKYLDKNGAALVIPAEMPAAIAERVRALAVKVFQVLCCEGMARVDFFLRDEDQLIVNEINTIPGFTPGSMFPKLWEATGVPCAQLIDRLLQLAIDRFEREQRLKTS